ncbi:hypothetical protein [Bacillus sp. Marseille-Q1617]|uniref:hypothetical protein n=1 Tax=Bacillus sp. Marseille-Q1617 TaxID=2736887 RepID=UPI0015884621|nr:hypothetical protein [Bacillus sp. Marseille-Q1617]
MKRNHQFLKILTIVLIMVLVPHSAAGKESVIASQKAGGYQYTVIKEENTYTWKIAHRGKQTVMEENKENGEQLEQYRLSVEDINSDIVELLISAGYFFIVIISVLIVLKKNKQILKNSHLIIIASFAGIALYNSMITFIDLNNALKDANYYYTLLTQ